MNGDMKMTPVQLADLQAVRDAGYHPLKTRIYRGDMIVYLPQEEIRRMIGRWADTKKQPYGLFICAEQNCWTACEGETGECYVESFHFEKFALRWLACEDGDDTERLHELDDRLFAAKVSI